MGTAESLLYYDEGEGGDVEGGESESGTIGSSGPSASPSNRPAPSHHHVPSSSFSAGGIAASGPLHSSRPRMDGGEARQQRDGENKNEQSPPLTLRGYVIGSSSTGKTSLVRRLRGENPFAEDDDVPGAAAARAATTRAAEQQRKRRPQRKRKMMALVPWKDRQSGQNCQLHVVEKPCGSLAAGGEADGGEANAHDVALEALGDRPDFCICMVDPRSDSSVEFAKTAIDALLNASLVDRPSSSRRTTTSNTNSSNSSNNLTPLNRPNICVLINYMDLVKVVDDEEDLRGENDDGLYRITPSRLMDVCADVIELQTSGEGDTSNDARTTIGPSIQVYPSSMVSCSGLTSLHSFIMLPYMRKKEVRLLQELELLHRSHSKSMADLRDGGVKAMQQAIDEGRARMSTAPPTDSGRRSIIQRQKGRGIVGTSGASAAAGWEKRVRIDETRNTNHFEGDEPLPSQSKSTPSIRHDDMDEMAQRLQEADQVRRLRRQQALDGEMASEEGQEKRSLGKQASSGSSRRSIISSKQRSAMQETISKIPATSEQNRTKKQSKNIAADPMRALEDFLGSDSDSDLDGDPIRSGGRGESAAEDGESDNDISSTGNNSSSDSDGDEDPRPSILLSDSDSEDDDFYYDEGGHAHYSHLDDRKKPSAQKHQVDEDIASKQTEPAKEISAVNDNVETPPKGRESKKLRSSNHCEEEKKDESPIGKPAADEESPPGASLPDDEEKVIDRQDILDSEDEAPVSKPNVDAESIEERVGQEEREVVDSEDESFERAELARPKILDSDAEDSVEKGLSEDSSHAVEILHSDDEDDISNSKILHSDDEESKRDLESKGSESPGNEVQVLDSDDESNPSVADRAVDLLHSDDDGDEGVCSSSPASPRASPPQRPPVADDSGDDERESSRVEILHSDEEEDDAAATPTPVVQKSIDSDEEEHDHQTIETEQVAPSIDGASDSEPPVVSSSSNVLVEALQPNDTDDEPEIESEAVTEKAASTRMSAAVAAALAAAEEEARRMMEATVPSSSGGEEKRRKKKKKSKDAKRSKKSSSSKIVDGGEEKKAKRKSRKSTSRSVEDS